MTRDVFISLIIATSGSEIETGEMGRREREIGEGGREGRGRINEI